MIRGSVTNLPIQISTPEPKPKVPRPADNVAKAYGADVVRKSPVTPPRAPKAKLRKKPASGSAPPVLQLRRPPGMPPMMPTGKAGEIVRGTIRLTPRAASAPPKPPPVEPRLTYLHRKINKWRANGFTGVYSSDTECFDEMLEYVGLLRDAGFTAENLGSLLQIIHDHVVVPPGRAEEIRAAAKAKAMARHSVELVAAARAKAKATSSKPPAPEPAPAPEPPAENPAETEAIVAVEPFDVLGLSMEAIDAKLRKMRERLVKGTPQKDIPKDSASAKPRPVTNKQLKKAERSLKRLVKKRSEQDRLNEPTEADKEDKGKDRAFARAPGHRARREMLIAEARQAKMSVDDYAEHMRATGDEVTEEDFIDAEIADADGQCPDENAMDEDSSKDNDKKGDASKKASL